MKYASYWALSPAVPSAIPYKRALLWGLVVGKGGRSLEN